jgi:hypothetical protein
MNEKEIISLEKSFALFKIYSKADNINFSIKNLLASFNLKLFIGLKDLKVLINPIKRNNPFFIESPEKNIDRYLGEIFNTEKIFLETVNLRDNLLKIFHCSWKIPKFLKLKDNIYESKKSKKVLWKFTTLFLDYVIISKITQDARFLSGEKKLIDPEKKVGNRCKTTKDQKKIRIDQLANNFKIISYHGDLEKSRLQDYEKKGKNEFKSSLSPKKNSRNGEKQQIYIEKYTKKKFIIISKIDKKALILSQENETLIIDLKKLKTKFVRIFHDDILSTKGFDKKGQILRPGNYCNILTGKHQNLEGKVLFLSDEKLFVKFLSNSTESSSVFSIDSNNVVLLDNSKHDKKNSYFKGEQFIKINEGEYKGYICRVLNIHKNVLEVLIISTSKIIKVMKLNVTDIHFEKDLELKA